MTTIDVSTLRAGLADALNRAGWRGERVVVERHGKPLAALVPMEDLRKLEGTAGTDDVRPACGKR